MGECLIFRKGGEASKPPVLDASYPQDLSLAVVEGDSTTANFGVSIATHGTPAVYTYQWYVNGVKVSGANNSSYVMTNISSEATYIVYCEVTNKAGTVTSRFATLTVEEYKKPILNSSYPSDITVVESANGSATFSVSIATAGNPASYTYQWYVNDSTVSGATSSSYTKSGLTSTGIYSVYCTVTNAAGTVTSRVATLTVASSQPSFTYSGAHELINDGNYNWRLKLKTSGTLNFTNLGTGNGNIDVFLVGGGGAGHSGGGGGGFTKTASTTLATGKNYTITIGSGGAIDPNNIPSASIQSGGTTSGFGFSASGGYCGEGGSAGAGGAGGNGGGGYGGNSDTGGAGGSYGANGGNGTLGPGGSGQSLNTTREFGEANGTPYAGGGGGCGGQGGQPTVGNPFTGGAGGAGGGGRGGNPRSGYGETHSNGEDGAVNTGGGGGGGYGGFGPSGDTNYIESNTTCKGGSGILIIRNKR